MAASSTDQSLHLDHEMKKYSKNKLRIEKAKTGQVRGSDYLKKFHMSSNNVQKR